MLTLPQILDVLGQEFLQYTTIVPDFYADEKITGKHVAAANPRFPENFYSAETLFSLRRKTDANGKVGFVESRGFKKINGKKPKEGDPLEHTGDALPGCLLMHSPSLPPQVQPCFDFELRSTAGVKDAEGRPEPDMPQLIFITFKSREALLLKILYVHLLFQ